MSQPVSASAPASTANLGPGFDCLGMALAPRCTVFAEAAEEWTIEHVGGNALSDGEPDGVLHAARSAVGDRPLALSVETEIPIGRGLGSSAAAFVAGAAAALRAVGEEAVPDRVYRIAWDLEAHHEQVAAAVYGGLMLIPAEGMPMRLPLHPTLRPVVAVPDSSLPTIRARAVLDGLQPLDVVTRSLARMGALTAGLITADPGMLAAAHGDEIHEGPRFPLSPEVGELIEIARSAGALHAARSGSGPAVVAIVTPESASRVAEAFARTGARVINAPIDVVGLI